MSKVLRHEAENLGLSIDKDGFIDIYDVLRACNKLVRKNNKKLIGDDFKNFNLWELMYIVNNNSKKRFEVCGEKIRASQGHSIQKVDPDLKPISRHEAKGLFGYHGTYLLKRDIRILEKILISGGLSKMGRNDVHMTDEHPDSREVKSGARSDCDVIVVIDVEKAMEGGLKFFFSKNKVLLCPGNNDGMIPVEYFHSICDRKTGEKLVVKDEKTGEVLWPIVPVASP